MGDYRKLTFSAESWLRSWDDLFLVWGMKGLTPHVYAPACRLSDSLYCTLGGKTNKQLQEHILKCQWFTCKTCVKS